MSYFARMIIAGDLDNDFVPDLALAQIQHKDPGVSVVDCYFALYHETWITLFYVLLDFATVHLHSSAETPQFTMGRSACLSPLKF
jgi:hypothetical protein